MWSVARAARRDLQGRRLQQIQQLQQPKATPADADARQVRGNPKRGPWRVVFLDLDAAGTAFMKADSIEIEPRKCACLCWMCILVSLRVRELGVFCSLDNEF